MPFRSSHGRIYWSHGNYGRFIAELHEILTDEQLVQLNVFEAYAHTDEGFAHDKCQSLADMLEISQPKLPTDEARMRAEYLIEALREAHAAKEPLRFT